MGEKLMWSLVWLIKNLSILGYKRSNKVLLARSDYPQINLPSATINTGASGNLTLGTALNTTYSQGAWCYFLATATCTPNIAAGWYYCVFSSTSVATIYTDGPGSAAFDFSVGGAYTGDAASVGRIFTNISIPAGAFGLYGGIDMTLKANVNNNANVKTLSFNINSVLMATASLASIVSLCVDQAIFRNQSLQTKQVGVARMGVSSGANAIQRQAEDLSLASTVSLVLTKATATDFIVIETFEMYIVT